MKYQKREEDEYEVVAKERSRFMCCFLLFSSAFSLLLFCLSTPLSEEKRELISLLCLQESLEAALELLQSVLEKQDDNTLEQALKIGTTQSIANLMLFFLEKHLLFSFSVSRKLCE